MSKRPAKMPHPYFRWTPEAEARLTVAYKAGGIRAAQAAFPDLSRSQLKTRAVLLKLEAPRVTERYAHLAPLAPEDDRPASWDTPNIKRTPVGQWQADTPRIRWVFDLGVAAC